MFQLFHELSRKQSHHLRVRMGKEVLETDMSDWLALPRMLLSPSNTEAPIGPPYRLLVSTDRSES